jgi:hypothetical protein
MIANLFQVALKKQRLPKVFQAFVFVSPQCKISPKKEEERNASPNHLGYQFDVILGMLKINQIMGMFLAR